MIIINIITTSGNQRKKISILKAFEVYKNLGDSTATLLNEHTDLWKSRS